MTSSDAMRFGSFHNSLLVGNGEGDLRGEHTTGCEFDSPLCYLGPDPEGMTLTDSPVFYGRNFGSYARSKLSNVLYGKELHKKLGYRTASVHPGMVLTQLAKQVTPGMSGDGFGWLYTTVQEHIMQFLLRHPISSAAIVLQGASSPGRGEFLNGMGQVVPESQLPTPARDPLGVAARLWDVTESLIKGWEKRQ